MSSFSWPVITSANPSVGGTGATAPSSATEVAGVDGGGVLRALSTTTGGVLNVNVSSTTTSPLPVTDAAAEASLAAINTKTPSLGQAAMAASVPVAIASNQTAIPATQSGTWNINNISGTVSLPTGAATETTLAAASAKLPATLGQKAMAASMAVAIASDQSAVPVSGSITVSGTVAATQSGTWNINNVSGTISLPTGAATETTLAKLAVAQGSTTSGQSGTLAVAAVTTSAPTYANGQTSPLSLDTTGALRVNATITNTVVAAASSAVTSVAGSASSVSLLASNSSRKNATFFNDSTASLYLKLGATASTTSFTVLIPSQGYYELPGVAVYTGAIDGIWTSAAGNVRITELS